MPAAHHPRLPAGAGLPPARPAQVQRRPAPARRLPHARPWRLRGAATLQKHPAADPLPVRGLLRRDVVPRPDGPAGRRPRRPAAGHPAGGGGPGDHVRAAGHAGHGQHPLLPDGRAHLARRPQDVPAQRPGLRGRAGSYCF